MTMNILDLMSVQLHFKRFGSAHSLHPSTMPLWSLMKGVQESVPLANLTAQGRSVLAEKGEEAFKAWKPSNLMSVYLAPKFRDPKGRADKDNLSGYTGLAGFDFDDVNAPAVLEALKAVQQVVCAGVSVSGKGVWCAARVSAATGGEYLAAFAEGVRVFQEAGLKGLDIGAHDPTRARFAASCPEAWWRYWADDVPAFEPVGDISLLGTPKKGRAKKAKLPVGYTMGPEMAFDEARQIVAGAAEVPDGERNAAKARMCGKLKNVAEKAGVDPAVYAPLFIETWDNAGSTKKKTRSIANRLLRGVKR